MHLIADDRERQVIPVLKALRDVEVKRITVGDYVYTHGGKIICIVERKSLADLASSIKDGRMDNHNKLLNAQKLCGCTLLYIIEGPAYPDLNKSFARMNFKCLQGKLDSIMFRNDVKIIWTRDIMHTAERLAKLCNTFERLIDQDVFSHLKSDETHDGGKDEVEAEAEVEVENKIQTDEIKIQTDEIKIQGIINAKHEIKLDMIHVNMLRSIHGVSYKASVAMLQLFNIRQLLMCDGVTAEDWYNAKNPDSMYKLGNRGIKMFNACKKLDLAGVNILSQIQGLTKQTAFLILNSVSLESIIKCEFEKNSIANIKKENARRVGNAIEDRIKLTFNF